MNRPIIFFYSLLFPASWIGFSLIFSMIFPGKRLGILGTSFLIGGAASLISWLFARQHQRNFTTSEYRKIIFYCIGWAILLEFCAFYFFIKQSATPPNINARTLLFVTLFTVVIDSLFIWGAFSAWGKRVIKSYLAKHGKPDEQLEKHFEKLDKSRSMTNVLLLLTWVLLFIFLAGVGCVIYFCVLHPYRG
jgi:hypothetical protein